MDEKKKPKHLSFIFLTVFSFFLFILLVILSSFYVAGNYQDFLDKNLLLILKASIAVSIILFFVSSVAFFVDFYLFITEKRFIFFLTFLLSFIFVAVSVLFAIVDTLIIVIS